MNTWLFLDPSLTALGWCAVQYVDEETKVLRAGRITPRGKTVDLRSEARLDVMAVDLLDLLNNLAPTHIGIETPSGKVNARRHGGYGSGLSVYGLAVGGFREVCRAWAKPRGAVVVSLTETEWSGGHGKEKHELVARRVWPELDSTPDAGHDVADSIALAEWWRSFRLAGFLRQEAEACTERDVVCCESCGSKRSPCNLVFVRRSWGRAAVCKEHLKPDRKGKKE